MSLHNNFSRIKFILTSTPHPQGQIEFSNSTPYKSPPLPPSSPPKPLHNPLLPPPILHHFPPPLQKNSPIPPPPLPLNHHLPPNPHTRIKPRPIHRHEKMPPVSNQRQPAERLLAFAGTLGDDGLGAEDDVDEAEGVGREVVAVCEQDEAVAYGPAVHEFSTTRGLGWGEGRWGGG